MKRLPVLLVGMLILALSGCVAPTGPVEVTRFHAPPVTRGGFVVEPAPGANADMEFRSYAAAVARQLVAQGYAEQGPGGGGEVVVVVRIERQIYQPRRAGSPVSVGLGGGTGSYGSGLGVGIGIDLSGPPPEVVETGLFVTLKERASGKPVWEGRASFAVRANSPLAQTHLGARKLAEALFRDFPGRSGETILVK